MMKRSLGILAGAVLLLCAAASRADDYSDTIKLFEEAGQSKAFFHNSYGYAVFPGIGKGGFIVGGAHGNGRVFRHGVYVGDTSMTQVSVGFQAGGQAYSMIIFFEDERAFKEFTSGSFEFGADASGGQKDATTAGRYYKGAAVFIIVKGGAMAEASVGGQRFSYTPAGCS